MSSNQAPTVSRIRIIPRADDFLDRNVGSSGEVFFDRTNNSLRVYNGKAVGGFEVARADLGNISDAAFLQKASDAGVGGAGGGASVDVGDTAPSSPSAGNLWLNTDTGRLYIYIDDGDSQQWVQPAAPAATAQTDAATLNGQSGSYYLDYANLTGVPTTILDFGISDGNTGQVLTTDGAGSFFFSTVVGGDGSGIALTDLSVTVNSAGTPNLEYNNITGEFTYTPPDLSSYLTSYTETSTLADVTGRGATTSDAITFSNTVTVNNTITVEDIETISTGSPNITSASTLTLNTADGVRITGGPLRTNSVTTTERDALTAANGDLVYNSTTNKFQGYANGTWVDLH